MFKCSCHRLKCDRGADAWNKFEDITHQWFFLQVGGATCTAKDKHGVPFFTKMSVSTWKNLEQPIFHLASRPLFDCHPKLGKARRAPTAWVVHVASNEHHRLRKYRFVPQVHFHSKWEEDLNKTYKKYMKTYNITTCKWWCYEDLVREVCSFYLLHLIATATTLLLLQKPHSFKDCSENWWSLEQSNNKDLWKMVKLGSHPAKIVRHEGCGLLTRLDWCHGACASS